MKNTLFYAIFVLISSMSSISHAQDTIPTVKSQSLLDTKSTPIHEPVSTPKYTHCIMIDKEDLCRQPWVQTVDKKNMKVTNTYTFSKDAITHECIIDKPLKHREHYQLPFCLADTIVDDFDSSLSKSKGCYVRIKREKDGTDLGTIVLGIVEFIPGEKIVLQNGKYSYFTWYAAKDTKSSQELSSYTDKAKRDSVLTAITLAKASQEEHELFIQFQTHYKGEVNTKKCIVDLDDINNQVSPLYGVQSVKPGDTYYIVTIPCTEDWYDGELYEPYFVRLWILDNHTPVSIHFGASEFTYRCSSEIRDAQKLSSIADITKRDSILRSIVVAQTKKEIPDVIAKYKYRFDKGHTVKRLVIDSDDLTNPLSFFISNKVPNWESHTMLSH